MPTAHEKLNVNKLLWGFQQSKFVFQVVGPNALSCSVTVCVGWSSDLQWVANSCQVGGMQE